MENKDSTLRIVARGIILNISHDKILLVKNKGADYWYLPGGGWEYAIEPIKECIVRECKEEVGMHVEPLSLAYIREFRNEKENKLNATIELIWICETTNSTINKDHIDEDPNGKVESCDWFSMKDLENIKVYPELLKDRFWEELQLILERKDVFVA